MVYLEKQYLNDGIKGLDLVKTELKLLLLESTAGDEFQKDRDRSKWSKWIEEQVVEAIYNPTMTYDVVNLAMQVLVVESLSFWRSWRIRKEV